MAPSWLRQLFKKRFVGQGKCAPIQPALTVEALEDRALMAVAIWTGAAIPAPTTGNNSALWSDPMNWQNFYRPQTGDDVIFPAVSGANKPPAAIVNNVFVFPNGTHVPGGTLANSIIDGNYTIGDLQINDDNYHIDALSANTTLRINGRIISNIPQALGSLTGLSLIGPTFATGGVSNLRIQLNGLNQEIRSDNVGVLYITADIVNPTSGAGGLLKRGTGTIGLSGNNTFTGAVRVNEGILAVASDNALGSTILGAAVDAGATMALTNGATISDSLDLVGDGVGGLGALRGIIDPYLTFQAPSVNPFGGGTWSGGIALIGNVTIGTDSGATVDVDTTGISGSGNLTKVGFDTLRLFTGNTYGGNTLIRQGAITIFDSNALSPNPLFSTTVFDGATLRVGNGLTVGETLFLNGAGFFFDAAGRPRGALSLFQNGAASEWTGTITLLSASSFGAALNAELLLSGPMGGAFAFTKVDQGNIRIARNNSATGVPTGFAPFTGSTFVNNGTLEIADALALGNTGTVTVNSTTGTSGAVGPLQIEGNYTFARPLVLNGVGFNTVGAVHVINPAAGGTSAITFSSTVTLGSAASLKIDGGDALSITGVIRDGSVPAGGVIPSLEKTGAGTLTLAGNNTYLGSTALREGLTIITSNQSLGGANGAGTRVFNGAALQIPSAITMTEDLTLSGTGISGGGVLLVGAGTSQITGLITLLGVNTTQADINVAAGGSLTFAGVVSGDADLHKIGAGELRLSGTASNTFLTTTFVDDGRLTLAKPAGLIALGGQVFVGDAAGTNNSAELRLETSNQIPESVSAVTILVTVRQDGLLNLNGFNETLGALTLVGGEITTATGVLTLISDVNVTAATEVAKISGNLSLGGAVRTFNVGNGAADPDLQIDAVISNGPGIILTGGGTLVLGGANTYTGPTTVTAGVLRLGAHNVLPDTTTVALAGGTTLDMNSFIDSIAAVTGGATTTLALGAGALIVGVGNTTSTFGGVITGAAGSLLSKIGTGTLTLTGASPAYTGTTFVGGGGTVLVNANQSAARVTVLSGGALGGTGTVGAITVNAGGQLSPGQSPAVLSANGDVVLSAGSSFIVEAAGTTVGTQYDQLAVTGTATLNNATLVFNPSFTPAVNDSFVILTATGGVTGTFSGLADLATFTTGTRVYQIHYNANDVTVTVLALASTATIQSSTNPSLPGQSVTFTVTITPAVAGDPTPTGTVQFYDNGVSIGTVALSPTGTLNLASASLTTAALTSGSHNITATFTPSSSYQARTQTDLALVQAVTVVSTVSMQALNGPSVFGDTVGFLARVAQQPGLAVPNGTITFINSTTGEVLGVVALDATGGAAINVSTLRVGTSIISAVYSGDAFYRAGSGTATQIVDRQSRMVVGTDAGPQATVQVFDPRTGALLRVLTPFDGYSLGVKVAAGDVNGDGIDDIIVSAGAGAPGGHVKVYNGADYSELASFFTFVGYTGGVNIAAGDVNGDGFDDIIVGTAIANDHVKAFSGRNPADTLLSFFAYGGGNPVGVTVAAGDVNGDGLADVVTGSATFAGHVKAFSGQNNGQLLGSYFAYGAGYLGGIYVAAGDLDGDGRAEIITGATNAPHIKALDAITGAERQSFIAYPGATFGVRVAAVDRDGDGLADILTGAGGSAPHVKLFDGQTLDLLDSFLAVPPNQSPSPGIFVGGSSK
ncbi:Autotransporter-associated beta strand repeat protein [Gemmata sp. SH-PL17]|uniref:beta strand repeat-containing protein n=1 Tax=Gemmata sp. SH-PL17 TaxID=1630693 RepID=UPI00078B56C2|nr:Ig-like domain repeat protein [Gemmata sp. SH-PL17]AMV22806.1 Autotransporter-associated beta strand repeat protein [Gemmata sp. SH-PL17]